MSTKQRVWAGETPYDDQTFEWAAGGTMAGLKKDVQGVYRAAMNGPEVRALYEALKGCKAWNTAISDGKFPDDLNLWKKVAEALAAYEKGLKEEAEQEARRDGRPNARES